MSVDKNTILWPIAKNDEDGLEADCFFIGTLKDGELDTVHLTVSKTPFDWKPTE